MLDKVFQLSQRFLRIKNREYIRYFLKKNDMSGRMTVVVGQRGVGKSTALIQHLLKYTDGDIFSKKILYVPSDHFSLGEYSLYEIAEQFVKYGGEMIFFDEVHKYKDWSIELKSIYDTFPELKILASGSSMFEIKKGSHDLSRRAIVYEMAGMSFREFIEMSTGIELEPLTFDEILKDHQNLSAKIAKEVKTKDRTILSLFNDYLIFGYYPYFIEYNDVPLFQITLEQQMHTTIESDIASTYSQISGESIRKLKKLLAAIAISVPFTPDISKLMKIVEVADNRTLKTYLQYLESGGIISQFGKSGRIMDSLEKPQKIYLNNTNQLYALSSENENRGTVRETFFANVLSKTGELSIPKKGDFLLDGKTLFEVGGKNKTLKQIADIENSFLALDDMETGFDRKIPLWLFGFVY